MAAKTDLWGEIAFAATPTPLAILREQAALLGTKTKNLVEATVKTEVNGDQFVHRFHLVVPALSNYTYELFKVRHGAGIYPITVLSEPFESPNLSRKIVVEGQRELATEQQFTEWLGAQLSSEKTMRIVTSRKRGQDAVWRRQLRRTARSGVEPGTGFLYAKGRVTRWLPKRLIRTCGRIWPPFWIG